MKLVCVLSVLASAGSVAAQTSPVPGNVRVALNPGQAQPVVNVGSADVGRAVSAAQVGVVNPAQVGVVNPGQASSRLNNPGRLDLQSLRALPGQLNPGQNDGFMLSPGQMDGREVRPGQAQGLVVSPGQVGNEVVSPGRGEPALTVDPGQQGGAVVARREPTVFVVGTGEGIPESNVRVVSDPKQVLERAAAFSQRVAEVRRLPLDQQNEALSALVDEMARAQMSSAAVSRTSGAISNSSTAARPLDAPGKSIWVTGTRLKGAANDSGKK